MSVDWEAKAQLQARSLYVLTAIEDGQVKQQEVYTDHTIAWLRFDDLKAAYGAANVCFASQKLLDRPPEPVNAEPEPEVSLNELRGGRWA